MTSGKGTSRPYVQFLGNSAIDVAGSLNLLRFKRYCLLLDAGWAQGFDVMTSYRQNKDAVKKVKCKEIDYIILSHLHIDHTGLIPALFAKGCHTHIYAPKDSIPFIKLMWEDSLKIHLQDCQKLQNKHGIKANPLYSPVDIENALNRIIEIPYNMPYQINENITLTYYPAGHIIHSAQIYLEFQEGSIIKRVGYTSDIGMKPQAYTEPIEPLPFCNLLIGESTYNVPTRPDKARDRVKDIEKIQSVVEQFNKILIPCFSLQRTQVMLKWLYRLSIDFDCPIYLDSPLASKFCSMWKSEADDWQEIMSKIKIIDSYESSVALQESNEHCVILSASGFLNGGRIVSHLKTSLDKPTTCILFCGFAGENNLASQIKSGQKEVNIDGTIVKNRANIVELRSFSSHASYEELMQYYGEDTRYDKLALHHGEFEGKVAFANILQNNLIAQGKSSRVIAVNADSKIYF